MPPIHKRQRELNILYLLIILANGIGHTLSQQLFKAHFLQFTTNYIHDSHPCFFFIYIWREQKGESRMELFTLSSTSVMYEFIEMYRKVMYNQTTLSLQKMKQQTKCYNVIVDIHAMNIGTAFICRV